MLPLETAADFQGSAASHKTSPRTIRMAIRIAATVRFPSSANTGRPPRKQARRKTPHPPAKSTAFRRAPADPLRYRDKTARDPNPPSASADAPRTSRPRHTRSQQPAALPTSTNLESSLEPSRKRASRAATEIRSDAPATLAPRSALPQSNRSPAPARESPTQSKPAPATNNSS